MRPRNHLSAFPANGVVNSGEHQDTLLGFGGYGMAVHARKVNIALHARVSEQE